ncbi:MAG: DNA repair protein RecO [Gammaproteobacteria bacterium]|nr:DNA repair protein RecO [Gammaproteobacteria bacterium]MCW8909060.1 DNA repair protein RecO [Gammaproteobacteria bacterium]MCW9004557.1 DNA repair protein RecO [Gammaproteobacteria bacterium]MCW9055958.1 DNA repair protein RecO [Gammaproteobacteria bacterium]
MRIQDQSVYILHHRPFRDSSLILELFTQNHGRLAVMSRGGSSPKSKLKNTLRPFQMLSACWSGKGELPVLSSAEIMQQNRYQLSGDALLSALYINELLMRLLHKHDVYEEVFSLYQQTLACLTTSDQIEICLRLFEKKLLQFLGFEMNLTADADSGEMVSADKQYIYYIEHGPVELSANNQSSTQMVIDGSSLLAFAEDDLAIAGIRKQIKFLTRYVLAYYLGDRPLKSRELFR